MEYTIITPEYTTPTAQDTDGDGISDENDNCPFNSNPDQTDTNENGQGDICDTSSGGPESIVIPGSETLG